jgi:hypothetical protein
MRIPALAGFGLFLCLSLPAAGAADSGWYLVQRARSAPAFELGLGATPGMTAPQAVYVRANDTADGKSTLAQKSFDATAWRGHRVRVTLHLKNEGGPLEFAAVQVNRVGTRLARSRKEELSGSGEWQTRQFVMDVPNTATTMAILVGVRGKGTGWIDSVSLMAVGTDVPLSRSWQGVDFDNWMERIDTSPVDGKSPFDFTRGPGDPYPNVHL